MKETKGKVLVNVIIVQTTKGKVLVNVIIVQTSNQYLLLLAEHILHMGKPIV